MVVVGARVIARDMGGNGWVQDMFLKQRQQDLVTTWVAIWRAG